MWDMLCVEPNNLMQKLVNMRNPGKLFEVSIDKIQKVTIMIGLYLHISLQVDSSHYNDMDCSDRAKISSIYKRRTLANNKNSLKLEERKRDSVTFLFSFTSCSFDSCSNSKVLYNTSIFSAKPLSLSLSLSLSLYLSLSLALFISHIPLVSLHSTHKLAIHTEHLISQSIQQSSPNLIPVRGVRS